MKYIIINKTNLIDNILISTIGHNLNDIVGNIVNDKIIRLIHSKIDNIDCIIQVRYSEKSKCICITIYNKIEFDIMNNIETNEQTNT
jgi:hypothetical protein